MTTVAANSNTAYLISIINYILNIKLSFREVCFNQSYITGQLQHSLRPNSDPKPGSCPSFPEKTGTKSAWRHLLNSARAQSEAATQGAATRSLTSWDEKRIGQAGERKTTTNRTVLVRHAELSGLNIELTLFSLAGRLGLGSRLPLARGQVPQGPKGGSCARSGEPGAEDSGPRRPVAPGSPEDTQISVTQTTERFSPSSARGPRGGHRPARCPEPGPPLPRPARGATAGERPRCRAPPRDGAAAAQAHRAISRAAPGTPRDGSALPVSWRRGNPGKSGDCESCPRNAPLRAAPPPSARASLAGRGRGAPVSGSRPSLTCRRRPRPARAAALSPRAPSARQPAAQREAPAPTGASGAGPAAVTLPPAQPMGRGRRRRWRAGAGELRRTKAPRSAPARPRRSPAEPPDRPCRRSGELPAALEPLGAALRPCRPAGSNPRLCVPAFK